MFWSILDYEYEDLSAYYKSFCQANSLKETKARRAEQRCKVYELKINSAKLNKTQQNHLNMLFVEAKWIYNDIIKDVTNKANDKYVKSLEFISVKYPEGFISRKLNFISSQMKQSIATGVISSIKTLSKLKAKGEDVGGLKFVSEYRSIDLKQYKNTYKIDFDKKTIKIQGLVKPVKVFGLEQIPKKAEIANAKLVKRFNEFYLYVTTYSKDERIRRHEVLGLDFGISENLIMSNGIELKYKTPISSKTIKLQQKLSNKIGSKKGEKKSKNYLKTKEKLAKSHFKDKMRRRDVNNKIFHYIDSYIHIACQDEQIANWKGSKEANKTIQYSAMSAIKAKIKNLASSRVDVLDKFKATTKTCSSCNATRKMEKSDRIYVCPKCGLKIDRNLNSTFNMINMSKFATEHSETMLADINDKDFINLSKIERLEIRLISREAH